MGKIKSEILSPTQEKLVASLTDHTNNLSLLAEKLSNYEDLSLVNRSELLELAESFKTKFDEVKETDFKCPHLDMVLSTNCLLSSCQFSFDSKEFLNCALYYNHKLKLNNKLGLLDMGVIFQQNSKILKKKLASILLKVQRKALKTAVTQDSSFKASKFVSTSSSKIISRLEKEYSANIRTVMMTTFKLFKDVAIISRVLKISTKTIVFYCEKYMKVPFDSCLRQYNLLYKKSLKRKKYIKNSKVKPSLEKLNSITRGTSGLDFGDLSKKLSRVLSR